MPTNAEDPATDWIVLAHLLRPQGRKGELLADLLTDFPDRFSTHPDVHLAQPGPGNTHRALCPATIAAHWLPLGRNHGRIVLRISGVDTIEAAEALAGLEVIVPPEARIQLEEDAEYISDLIGCQVFDRGTPIGQVTGVDFATTPDGSRRLPDAAPLLTVEDASGQEVLIPYVAQFLIHLDTAARRIEMSLPEGLIDINRKEKSPDED